MSNQPKKLSDFAEIWRHVVFISVKETKKHVFKRSAESEGVGYMIILIWLGTIQHELRMCNNVKILASTKTKKITQEYNSK